MPGHVLGGHRDDEQWQREPHQDARLEHRDGQHGLGQQRRSRVAPRRIGDDHDRRGDERAGDRPPARRDAAAAAHATHDRAPRTAATPPRRAPAPGRRSAARPRASRSPAARGIAAISAPERPPQARERSSTPVTANAPTAAGQPPSTAPRDTSSAAPGVDHALVPASARAAASQTVSSAHPDRERQQARGRLRATRPDGGQARETTAKSRPSRRPRPPRPRDDELGDRLAAARRPAPRAACSTEASSPGEARVQVLAAQRVQPRRAPLALGITPGLAQDLEVMRAGELGHRQVEAPARALLVRRGQRRPRSAAGPVAEACSTAARSSLRARGWAIWLVSCTTFIELSDTVREPSYKEDPLTAVAPPLSATSPPRSPATSTSSRGGMPERGRGRAAPARPRTRHAGGRWPAPSTAAVERGLTVAKRHDLLRRIAGDPARPHPGRPAVPARAPQRAPPRAAPGRLRRPATSGAPARPGSPRSPRRDPARGARPARRSARRCRAAAPALELGDAPPRARGGPASRPRAGGRRRGRRGRAAPAPRRPARRRGRRAARRGAPAGRARATARAAARPAARAPPPSRPRRPARRARSRRA